MGRNLIVCLDGTDNQFSSRNTNVVRLFQALERNLASPLSYYDPGVGTIWQPGTLSRISKKLQMALGAAFGLGVSQNVAEAYSFLMDHYHSADDKVFIFGFSRGALEARILAGLIYRCGLLEPQLKPLEPYATLLFRTAGNNQVVRSFQETFARTIDVEFLGIWDTVTSVGNVWSPMHWPHTADNPCVRRVAHAIAIDERRAFFRQNRWTPRKDQVVDEVWFAGVHSDVGGGYDPSTGRLWAITLEWMAGHASAAGLQINLTSLNTILGAGKDLGIKDCLTSQHDSLTPTWKLLELVPRTHQTRQPDGSYGPPHVLIPALQTGLRGRPRTLTSGEKVHRSAVERFVGLETYRPETLVRAGMSLDEAKRFLATDEDTWTVPSLLQEGRVPPTPSAPVTSY